MYFSILLVLVILAPQTALAYLDPASGSAILYVITAVATTVGYFCRNMALAVFNFLAVKLRFRETGLSDSQKIVFYSEGKQYWNVFQPILQWLSQNGQACSYLTSDKNDPGLKNPLPHVTVKYIGSINFAAAYLGQIKADFVGMTTPQLDVLTLKRSKGVKHYAHIVHAPVDVFTYRKFAFDYFDSVFCSGPHQIRSIRELEKKRKTKVKELLPIGCTYYDAMLENLQLSKTSHGGRRKVLVAPTWKEYSLLHSHGEKFFERLLSDESYDVILRPHPQTYVSYPEVIGAIESKFKNHPRFTIDRAPSGEASMQASDILISDLSGIIWDYVFLFNKPVLLVPTPLNLDGFEATELKTPMWELESIPKIGAKLSDSDILAIDKVVSRALGASSTLDIKEFREQSIYNWGRAGEAAGEAIVEIVS